MCVWGGFTGAVTGMHDARMSYVLFLQCRFENMRFYTLPGQKKVIVLKMFQNQFLTTLNNSV